MIPRHTTERWPQIRYNQRRLRVSKATNRRRNNNNNCKFHKFKSYKFVEASNDVAIEGGGRPFRIKSDH